MQGANPALSRAKMLGGIGAILTLLLPVPYFVGAALVIIGWILIIWAVKNISDATADTSIFNNAMVSVIFSILGTAIFAIVVAAAVLGFLGLGNLSPTTPPTLTPGLAGLIGGIILGLALVWICAIVGSFFLWRSFKLISTKLNMGLFGTGALIYFIGSILTIILVGFLLMFIAQILFIVAFFTIPDKVQTMMPQQQTMTSP